MASIEGRLMKWEDDGKNPDPNLIDSILRLSYGKLVKAINDTIAVMKTGEIPRSRADSVAEYANMVNIDKQPDHQFFEGAWTESDGWNIDKISENITAAYNEAVSPEKIFAGTNIMVVTASGFRIFTPQSLAQVASRKLIGKVTQNRAQLNLSGFEVDDASWQAAEAELAEKGELTDDTEGAIEVTIPGIVEESKNNLNFHKLFEWAVK